MAAARRRRAARWWCWQQIGGSCSAAAAAEARWQRGGGGGSISTPAAASLVAAAAAWRQRGSACGISGSSIMLRYEKLWYLFYSYLRVSPGTMQKCILHDSIRYRNIHSRDPITLLSMDIVFETFLEIGVSDLLVLTRRLQDSLSSSLGNISSASSNMSCIFSSSFT
jgi:hypothetical protein